MARVVLFSWLSVGRQANRQSTKKHNTYHLLYIYSIPSDDGLQICQKHVEVDWRNKLRINSASGWLLLHRYIEMHGQQNIKKIKLFIFADRRWNSAELQKTPKSCRNVSWMLQNCYRFVAEYRVSIMFLFCQFSVDIFCVTADGTHFIQMVSAVWNPALDKCEH
jgi:hypothetical protein